MSDFKLFNSVRLDAERCNGCINCMKRCPTEAIRVRNGKAAVDKSSCIGCGECVKVCKYGAKVPVYDSLSIVGMSGFPVKIALPAPTLFAQFNNLTDVNIVLTALKQIGFDDVFEVSRANELISAATKELLEKGDAPKPLISTSCQAVLKLILFRYQNLIKNLSPLLSPAEIAARLARDEAVKKYGVTPEEVGVFFISPCSAYVASLKAGTAKQHVDGVLSQSEVYFHLLPVMGKAETEKLSKASKHGLEWVSIGGESRALGHDAILAADGIENVITVLDQLDNGQLPELDFIELAACAGGCVGGILNVENPFVARAKSVAVRKALPDRVELPETGADKYLIEEEYEPIDLASLSDDRAEAMKKVMEIEAIIETLPGLDCGYCGAPTCHAFAEDVARGIINRNACRYAARPKKNIKRL